jgi:hypothetical protein
LQPPHIERQADHAVGIAAAQIGLDHQAGNLLGIAGGKPASFERAAHEGGKRSRRDARHLRRAFRLLRCDTRFGHLDPALYLLFRHVVSAD